jgi:hypothetical protein
MIEQMAKTLGMGAPEGPAGEDKQDGEGHAEQQRASDEALGGMDMMELMKGIPLKTLASFAGGSFDNRMLEGVIQQLNQSLSGK